MKTKTTNHKPTQKTRWLLALLVAILYVLHQDIWFWRTARPLVLGFVPIGLAYHAGFSIAAALVLALLVRYAWPAHLEEPDEPGSINR